MRILLLAAAMLQLLMNSGSLNGHGVGAVAVMPSSTTARPPDPGETQQAITPGTERQPRSSLWY